MLARALSSRPVFIWDCGFLKTAKKHIGGGSGEANACAHAQLESVLHEELCFHQPAKKRAGLGEGSLRAGVRHQDYKLVASIAKAPVLLAGQLLQTAAGGGQQFATYQVTVRVIDQLELVQINKCQAQRLHQPAAALQLAAQNVVEMAYVEEASRVVCNGQLLDAGHIMSVLDCNKI